jgi:hypothetical protein
MKQTGKPNVQIQESMDVSRDGAVGAGGRAIQRTQSQYTTAIAVQRQRDLAEVQQAVLKEASLSGKGFFYSMRFKTKKEPFYEIIEGPSIDGAMILVRNFMNCVVDVELEGEGPMHWIFRASFVDLESGFTESRLFRQRKNEAHGGMDNDRLLDIAFQIGQSKAQRNVIVKSMPEWLVSAAMQKAKEGAAKAYSNLRQAVPAMISKFARLGVPQAKLEARLGIPSTAWTANDLVTLAAIGNAIKDGQSSVEAEFPAPLTQNEPTGTEEQKDAESPETQGEPEQKDFVRDGFE